MKIAAFEGKEFEVKDFARAKNYGLDVSLCMEVLSEENISLAKGCEGVTVLGESYLNESRLKTLHGYGVKYVATRTIGYNHIDLACARKLGMRVSNASYEPYNVADFAVMLLLMLLRKAKIAVCRALVNDFSLDGMCGRELRSLTVGVVGAGKIGRAVMRNLSGFGCKILCCDPYVTQASLPDYVTCVSFDTLLKESDAVTLHVPYSEENHHLMGRESIAKMKHGALLINTARGGLVDTTALIEALENGHLGGAGIDTVENEEAIFHTDLRTRVVPEREVFYLKQFPNVIYTSHYAFFTEEATSSMVESALKSLSLFEAGKDNPYEIK